MCARARRDENLLPAKYVVRLSSHLSRNPPEFDRRRNECLLSRGNFSPVIKNTFGCKFPIRVKHFREIVWIEIYVIGATYVRESKEILSTEDERFFCFNSVKVPFVGNREILFLLLSESDKKNIQRCFPHLKHCLTVIDTSKQCQIHERDMY